MKILSLICLPVLLAASPASAASYLFSATGGIIGSGTIVTDDAPVGTDAFLITAITGTYNGAEITGLLPPGSYPSVFANDNLLYTGGGPIFDYLGISFTTTAGSQNLYSFTGGEGEGGEGNGAGIYYDLSSGRAGTVTISAVSAAVPEPATWAMMLVGFGAIGIAMRRKRTSPGRIAATA